MKTYNTFEELYEDKNVKIVFDRIGNCFARSNIGDPIWYRATDPFHQRHANNLEYPVTSPYDQNGTFFTEKITHLNKLNEFQSQKFEALNNVNTSLSRYVSDLEDQLASKDTDIFDLNMTVMRCHDERETLRLEVADLEEQLSAANRKLDVKDALNSMLNYDLGVSNRMIEEVRGLVCSKN